MVEPVKKSTREYNQDLLKGELAAALIIRNQFYALTKEMYRQHPVENVRALQINFDTRADEAIDNMLKADSKEAFDAHKKRFDKLVERLRTTLQLGAASEEELVNYYLYQQVQKFLKKLTPANASVKAKKLIDSWGKSPNFARKKKYFSVYADWEVKLNYLAKNPDDFEDYKRELQADIVALVSEENLANRASVALIERNAHSLAAIRLSYLKEKFNRKELSASLTWIAFGIVVGVAGTVLGFAFPALIIPGFLIGAAAMSHGAVDFFKESISLGAKISSAPELGDREVTLNTKQETEDFEKRITPPIPEKRELLEGLFSPKVWSAANEWQQVVGYAMVFVSMAIAVTGFVTLFPGMAIPLTAVIALTAIGSVITLVALGLYADQVFQTRKELSELNQGVEEKITADQQVLAEPIDHLYRGDALSSDGRMLHAFREKKGELKMQIKGEPLASAKLFPAAEAEFAADFKSLGLSR